VTTMARRNATVPPASDVDDGSPSALVFIEIPAGGGEVLDGGLPSNRQRRSGRRGPEELFEGVGGITPRDVDNLRRAAKKVNSKGLRVLRGSFPFAVNELLAERLTDRRALRYITFLREPVERAIAHYQLAVTQPLEGLPPLPPGTSFDDAISAEYVHDNLETRMLSGSLEPFAEVTDAMLEDAKRNLRERFVYFGLADRLDESLVLARLRLGLGNVIYRAERAGPESAAVGTDAPHDVRAAAERANAYDAELYRYAEELFNTAPEREELEFHCEAAAVRASMAEGEIEVTTPVPPAFHGGEREWGMLVRTQAECMRLEWELEGSN
jgi:hypothetical protein